MLAKAELVYTFNVDGDEDLTKLEREFKEDDQLMSEMLGIGWESPVSIKIIRG